MKKSRLHILAAMMAALTMTSCDKEDAEPMAVRDYPSFSATIEDTGTRVTGDSWEEGDKIGVYCDGVVNLSHGHQGNGVFTVTDPAKQIIFTDDSQVRFYAYYPYGTPAATGVNAGKITTYNTKNLPQTDQKSFDYLWAEAEGSKADPDVKFNFTHRMSKITLVFRSKEIDVSAITAFSVGGLYVRGTFDPTTGKCAPNTSASTTTATITLSAFKTTVKDGEPAPPIIVFPQTLKANPVSLSVTAANAGIGTITGHITFRDGVLEPGNNYMFVVNISKTGLRVNAITITDWDNKDQGDEWEAM